jgi:hypothetical protein
MEAISTSKMSVNFHHTTRRSIPETVIFKLVAVRKPEISPMLTKLDSEKFYENLSSQLHGEILTITLRKSIISLSQYYHGYTGGDPP